MFDLLFYQGLSQAEAAAVLGVSEVTIKRRWRSARMRLVQTLGGEIARPVSPTATEEEDPMIADIHADDTDPRLDQLLLRWEELQRAGREPLSPTSSAPPAPSWPASSPAASPCSARFDPLLTDPTIVAAAPPGPEPAGGPSPRVGHGAGRVSATSASTPPGGLGEVFLARNAELNREVALKFLKPGRAGDPESRRRFLQEAEVTGRLEHPGVVPIYALGTDAAGAPCYAMRFIRGETLQDAIDAFHAAETPGRDPSERSLALRELLNRFVSICNTVAYAHSRGILHRDLKPRNVMLGKYDETLVVDWGLAKPFDRDESAGRRARRR